MQSCSFACTVLISLLIIFITGSESGVPVVKVKYGGSAVLPCSEKCSGVASWTPSHKSTDILADCDQTSCRSVKEGYQMIYNQYLQGDLSLIITEADYSKRGRYTCDCDGTDKCDMALQIEALNTSKQMESSNSLLMELEVSDSVEVIYTSTGSADGFSGQICTVIGGSLQCKPEYKHRTSLLSSSVLELRDMKESDSGVYTIRDTKNNGDIHIYNITVTGSNIPTLAIMFIALLLVVVVLVLVLVLVCKKKERKNLDLEINNDQMQNITQEKVQGYEDKIQEQQQQINNLEAKNQGNEDKIQEQEKQIKDLVAEKQENEDNRIKLRCWSVRLHRD